MKSMISKKSVKFCPLCGGQVIPEKETQYSVCLSCKLAFASFCKPEPIARMPVFGGHTHRQECIGNNGRGKVCHSSVAEAYARALALKNIPHRHRDKIEFYQCRWCEKIHIGHGGKKKKNNKVSYTNEQARYMYEKALANGDLIPYPENYYEQV